jgi:hypothetical protein
MATPLPAPSVLIAKPAISADTGPQNGLASNEAYQRLEKFGPNAMPDTSMHPLRMALENERAKRQCENYRDKSNSTNAWRNLCDLQTLP